MGLVMCSKCGFKVSDEYSTCFVCGNVLKRGAVTLNAPKSKRAIIRRIESA